MHKICLLGLGLLLGCAAAPTSMLEQYRSGQRKAAGAIPLHADAQLGQFHLYRVQSGTRLPTYMSVTVTGRINDLVLVELDEGQGYTLAYLVDPSVGWSPRTNEPNVRRAWLWTGTAPPIALPVEDGAQLSRRNSQELGLLDSTMTLKQTRRFSGLRRAGRGWSGERTTVRSGQRLRAADWRASQGWFGGLIQQDYLGERTVLYAMGSHGRASVPLDSLLRKVGWTPDRAQASKAHTHALAELIDGEGQRRKYYWPAESNPATP